MMRRPRPGPHPLSCRAVGKLLQSYLDAEVPDAAALRIADHLDACRRCGLEADDYRVLIVAIAKLSPPADQHRLERLRSFADALTMTA